ncbi:MAG: hypothetical protein LUI05_06735 [Oscillospiraceae bacterium]|nr:hypothetical protein [Oscillospiraceae bacterium]
MIKKAVKISVGILILAYAASLIYFARDVGAAVVNSINVCIQTIIPSLFAFMVISGFIISSNLYSVISVPFKYIARYVFHIPEEFFSVFLLSSVAGYPVGAKLLTDLYDHKRIDKETSEEMLGYCYMGGPAFFCGAVGLKLYSSIKVGMLIFLCIFLSNLLIAVFIGFRRRKLPLDLQQTELKVTFRLSDLIKSINSGAAAMLKMCAAIVFFSTLIAILDKVGIIDAAARFLNALTGVSYENCAAILKSILEISSVSTIKADIGLLPIITALLSFGGLCVIIQTEGVINSKILTKSFYICRTISIFISYFCCRILIYVIGINNIVQTGNFSQVLLRHNPPIPSLFLLIMTILLLSNNLIVKSKKM